VSLHQSFFTNHEIEENGLSAPIVVKILDENFDRDLITCKRLLQSVPEVLAA
jgi:hypothetical protein